MQENPEFCIFEEMNTQILTTNFLRQPEGITPNTAEKDYHDYLLSEIAANNNFGIYAIEPKAKEEIHEDNIDITVPYRIFTIPIADYSIPMSFSIMPAISINSCQETYDIIEILWKFMPQDLVLRFYNNQVSPVWICSLIKGKYIWLPGYEK